jgi:2-oxoglutarate dehydrogenase E2 component (dihydrolipoamide succinyltransferase)
VLTAPAPVLAGVGPATNPGANLAASGPAARKLADEKGVASAAIQPSGKDGRAIKADVMAALSSISAAPAPATKPAVPAGPRLKGDREERVKMTRLRRTIANRLKEAQNTAAMLTTFNEVDMTGVMALRERVKEDFEKKHGARLGFMSFFVKACIAGLKELPAVNAEIEDDELVYKNYYDIGVAVGTPNGLVVPVLRDADVLDFGGIEKGIGELGRKARDGKLSIADLTGGTFTISNGGVYGSLMSTPILNPPQSAILGMHKIQQRPMVVGGEIKARPMMYLALSYDHRIIDGREAVLFLVRVKACIEDPERLLLGV